MLNRTGVVIKFSQYKLCVRTNRALDRSHARTKLAGLLLGETTHLAFTQTRPLLLFPCPVLSVNGEYFNLRC